MKDSGKGIDPDLLRQFNRSGGEAWLGLEGMSERLRGRELRSRIGCKWQADPGSDSSIAIY